MNKSKIAIYKRTLFAAAEVSPDYNFHKANQQIGEAVTDALESLPEDQRDIIEREMKHLMDEVKGLGVLGALELLASVSEYLPVKGE